MAINISTLFTRWGHMGGRQNDLFSLASGTATTNVLSGAQLLTAYNQFQTDFATAPVWTSVLDGLFASFVATGQGNLVALTNLLPPIASTLLINTANADTPLLQETLTYAMQLLQTQMAGADHVSTSGAAAGAQTNVGTPIGNPVIVMSLLLGNGLTLEYIYPETLTFFTGSDQNSTATLNNEPITVTGQTQALNAWQWPGGSGCNTTVNITDSTANATASLTSNNALVNSNFAVFSNSNYADNWKIESGTAGAAGNGNWTKDTGNPYVTGGNDWIMQADGAAHMAISQKFNTAVSTVQAAGGSPYVLTERTNYHVNLFLRNAGGAPAAGVLQVALVNANTLAVLTDDQGNNCSFTKSVTAIGATYTAINGVIRTPSSLPAAGVKLQISQSTQFTAGTVTNLSNISMTPAVSLYGTLPQGPYCSIHAGSTPVVVGDSWTVGMTTSMALTTWQGILQFWFAVSQLQSITPGIGCRIPTAGGSLINNNLIV